MLNCVTIIIAGQVYKFYDLRPVDGFNTWRAGSLEMGPELVEGCDGPLPTDGGYTFD